ncbi:MAG: hypothetical protein WA347_08455 [Rhabdochlamydiaceae bacterium]
MVKSIFRKVSLERIASPEQIDRLLVIVRIPGWIALLCMIVLTVVILIWSVFGAIPTSVSGVGVFFKPSDIQAINSSSEGIVETIDVKTGDTVKKGIELLTLYSSRLSQEYEGLKNKIRYAEAEMKIEQEKSGARMRIRLDLNRNILQIQELKRKFLEETLSGAINDPFLMFTLRKNLFDVQMAIQVQRSGIEMLEIDHSSRWQWELLTLKEKMKIAESDLKNLRICAPEDGTILEIDTLVGQAVRVGSPLIWFESASKPGEEELIFGFFPIDQGTQIKEGMKADIAFENVNQKLYGKMIGKVVRVLPYAASKQDEILQSIPSEELRDFITQRSVSILVEIAPVNNSETPSGYQWTTPKGPPFPILRGSIASVNIVTAEKKPFTYLISVSDE